MFNLRTILWKYIAWSGVLTLSFIGALFMAGSAPATSSVLPSPHILIGSTDKHDGLSPQLQEQKTSSQVWFVLLPFQNAPGPNTHGPDPQAMKPFYERVPPKNGEAHHSGIRFDRCIDTGTCLLIIPEKDNTRGQKILVVLFGIDVPHLQGACEQERALATNAVELLQNVLSEASQIDVYDHYRVSGAHMARVVADGQDLAQLLINQGLAAYYGSARKDWCND